MASHKQWAILYQRWISTPSESSSHELLQLWREQCSKRAESFGSIPASIRDPNTPWYVCNPDCIANYILKCILVSRHISNMTLTAAPTFPQPNYYGAQGASYTHRNPPPYSEYDQQLHYLSSMQAQQNDSGYWENTRNDAVRMLNEQAGPYVDYTRIYALH